ncbi:MAG: hypothetical protein ACPGUU_06650 [Flavobacteriaceae bacterium]
MTSCNVIPSLQVPNYHYNYATFNKGLDYNGKKYLLNPTNYKTNELSKGTYSSTITKFFKKKLGRNLYENLEVKDDNGKILIPFDFNYEITDSQFAFLKQNTDLDYIILTKMLSLEHAKNEKLNSVDERRFKLARTGGISFIKIIDIKTKSVLIEVSCSAVVILNRNMQEDLETENHNRIPKQQFSIYKSSKKLREKTMKKLLKKIK